MAGLRIQTRFANGRSDRDIELELELELDKCTGSVDIDKDLGTDTCE